MTNREYMAHQLSNPEWIDDGGASYESMVQHNISCPYFAGGPKCHCKKLDPWISPSEEMCNRCKFEWLEADVND